MLAVPRLSLGEKRSHKGQNGHQTVLGENVLSLPSEPTVVGEVETLTLSHPMVRLDFFKATGGFSDHKHEDIVREANTSKFTVY